MNNILKCDLCGSEAYEEFYKGDVTRNAKYLISEHKTVNLPKIVRCRKCGLIYTEVRDAESKIYHQYANMRDEEYVREFKGRLKTAKAVLKNLEKYKGRTGKLLDIGCAYGIFCKAAEDNGWDVTGIEISEDAVEYIRRNLKFDVHKGSLKEVSFPDNYFDVITMNDVVEHMLNPRESLIKIRKMLKPNGMLYINTPDITSIASMVLRRRWWGLKQSHLYYFSKKTLKKLLKNTGFSVISGGTLTRYFSVRYMVKQFENYNQIIFKILLKLSRMGSIENSVLGVNFKDQISLIARKSRKIEYLPEIEIKKCGQSKKRMKVVAVLPAYNAEKTLSITVRDIPKDKVNEIILVDDCSTDNTVKIAMELGLKVYLHAKNKGYGANQKTCYEKALMNGAEIIVMVHPDYQYDPRIIPRLVEPIERGHADAVLGSRMLKGGALKGGMPLWKHNANILLTALENVCLGTFLTEYHSGFRAYSRKALQSINFKDNSNSFVFDTEIIVQLLIKGFRIEEIPIQTRYFDEASSIKLFPCLLYGLGIIQTMIKFILNKNKILEIKQFK